MLGQKTYKSKTHKYKIIICRMPNVYYWVDKGLCVCRKEIGWKNIFKSWEILCWSEKGIDDLKWAKSKINDMIEKDNELIT